MRFVMTIAVTLGTTLALAWVPMSGMWWHLARWAVYLPLLSISARRGPGAGLWAGAAASLLWALVMALREGDVVWWSTLLPDFAAVGYFGGRLLGVWPPVREHYKSSAAVAWPEAGRIAETELDLTLKPLVSIEGAAGLLADDDTPAHLRHELAGIISKECERLSAGITGLIHRVPAPKTSEIREADLATIVDAAVREAEFVLCGQGKLIHREIPAGLPRISCHPEQLRSLLSTLTINAVQTVPAGDSVVLNARSIEDGIILDVTDRVSGSYIDRFLGGLFGPRRGTAGVGLAAAYEIVRWHGGTINAKFNVRKGFEFSVWLPVRRERTNGDRQGPGGGGR